MLENVENNTHLQYPLCYLIQQLFAIFMRLHINGSILWYLFLFLNLTFDSVIFSIYRILVFFLRL